MSPKSAGEKLICIPFVATKVTFKQLIKKLLLWTKLNAELSNALNKTVASPASIGFLQIGFSSLFDAETKKFSSLNFIFNFSNDAI